MTFIAILYVAGCTTNYAIMAKESLKAAAYRGLFARNYFGLYQNFCLPFINKRQMHVQVVKCHKQKNA